MLDIPNYINGRYVYNKNNKRMQHSYDGKPLTQVHVCGYWDIEAAVETASRVHPVLRDVPLELLQRALDLTMNHYFADSVQYETVTRLTGSPLWFTQGGINIVKDWCRELSLFIHEALPCGTASYTQTAPLVAVLPSNSEQESLYVLAQAILARNATLLRPSSKGASAYTAYQFALAWNTALEELHSNNEIGSDLQYTLARAVNILNTGRNYLEQLSVDGWNYLFFGDDSTISTVDAEIRSRCTPRKVVGYGTGLSTTIVMDDAPIDSIVPSLLESISVNAGNECISTDVVYVQSGIYDDLTKAMDAELATGKYDAMEPLSCTGNTGIGYVSAPNVEWIESELARRGRIESLRGGWQDGPRLHTSLIPMHEYETAMEYPGPIATIRRFNSVEELRRLVHKDLTDNEKPRSLVTSIFTGSAELFHAVATTVVRCYTLKHNRPTHDFTINEPHQGIYLLRELVDTVHVHANEDLISSLQC